MICELDVPARSLVGADARLSVADEVLRAGWSRALLVSDGFHEGSGSVAELAELLKRKHVGVSVYAQVNSEPDTRMIDEGVAQYRAEKCDGVIALGGGSPIDTAKAIAAMACNGGAVVDLMGVGSVPKAGCGIIAIPTTAGTGSEATKVVVISDSESSVKMTGRDRAFLPAVAVLDHKLTMTMPRALTAAVGVDALTHAIEAYVSRQANTFTDAMALDAVRLIYGAIRRVFADGADESARYAMMMGSFESGIAFSNSSVGLVHSMSEPLGACFHVPHGLSNAMLLAAVTEFSIVGAPDRYAQIARCMKLADESVPDEECCKVLVKELHQLNRDLGIPSVSAYGIDRAEYRKQVEKMAVDAGKAGSTSNNPVQPSVEQIVEIFRAIYNSSWICGKSEETGLKFR